MKRLCLIDRNNHLMSMASDLNNESIRGRFASTFRIVIILAEKTASAAPSTTNNAGLIVSSKHDVDLAWIEHYAKVFNASKLRGGDIMFAMPEELVRNSSIKMNVYDTLNSIMRLKDNKGMGGDAIPAELLKAGSWALAKKVNDIE